jgi:hypothetical protein
MAILGKISEILTDLSVLAWDNGIFLANLVTPKLKPGQVVPEVRRTLQLDWSVIH